VNPAGNLLWILTTGHAGSSFLMRIFRDMGLLPDPKHQGEWDPVTGTNESLLLGMRGGRKGNFFVEGWGETNVKFGDHANPGIKMLWPWVVKDPRWSATINLWLLAGWQPRAALFMTRKDVDKATSAILRAHDPDNRRLWEQTREWVKIRHLLLEQAEKELTDAGVEVFHAWYPETFEDPLKLAELTCWLAEDSADLDQAELHKRIELGWQKAKVNIR
jgi:hypothetical protein